MDGHETPPVDFFLGPGHIYLSHEPTLISTVVGSSVAVSLWDSNKQHGGMAHFLYPVTQDRRRATAQYGNVAVKCLVTMFLDQGIPVKALRAQIFGGAQMAPADCMRIARENVQVARKVLRNQRITILSEDTGGSMGRKIVYNTQRNEAIVYKVHTLRRGDWYPYVRDGR